ncbi:MAG: LysR family transcriptional regulator [Candidatus Electrothrix aestuarii]|uniref:LysR family transcriptional regulator n=1 Tax=Candidatus Electrothrix aestuarii TaxID=3062594 RepID=A0AAU8LQL0_9BACT|nr:LysR family transcriptional regulator [Candidatus Electrothrix aestuarii]WPD24569.1 MAG: LysR family transcriptional regulator [Candidatus Electrothrix sp. GW3-3]
MAITLRQFQIFIAVAETKQVTRASKKLFLTQSAVSMALAELENQLGGPLFDRHGRSLLLNDRGRYLLPMAKNITNQVRNIEALLSEQKETIAGSLEIIASSTIGNYVLPYPIALFMRMHPEAHINMMVDNTKQAERLVAQGVMDLGFVEGGITDEAVRLTPWFEDELRIIVSSSHPLADQKRFVLPDDLAKTTWVLREDGSGTAEIFKNKLGEHATQLNVVTRIGHTESIKKAVEAGVGAACLSELAICREEEHGWLKGLAIKDINMRRQLSIIQHKDKTTTRLMDEFLHFCRILAECGLGRECLSSPKKLNELLNMRAEKKKQQES